MKLNDTQLVELEKLIDVTSLASVVAALVRIAHEKAQHIRENYQDRVSAAPWNRAGNALERIESLLSNIGV